jgi:hypothetical protein
VGCSARKGAAEVRPPEVDKFFEAWQTLNSAHCDKPFCHGTHVLRLEYENALENARQLLGTIDPADFTPEECTMLALDSYRLNWEVGFNNAGNAEGQPDRTFRPPWRRDERLAPDECELCYDTRCDLCHPHPKSSRGDLRDARLNMTQAFIEGLSRGLPRFLRQFEETL